ncbi:MAG: DUF2851 family protein [Chloroflexota bacterium]|nr:DUF2851 family protein [Chloroflexota bacterium]
MEGITESMVCRVWQGRALRGRWLVMADGRWVRVVHPGRPNPVAGPDFHHAIVATAGGEARGDVEVHVRSSSWRHHGHHRDPQYNGVILHVVMWDDAPGRTVRADGASVPVVALHPYVEVTGAAAMVAARERCWNAARWLGVEGMGRVLDRAGDERFRAKAGRFGDRLKACGADQAVYEGLMRALGYGGNGRAFEALARRVPLQVLEECAVAGGSSAVERELGRALDAGAGGLPWRRCGIRPANMPSRRIAAAAPLLARYVGRGGLGQGLASLVRQADVTRGYRGIEDAVMVREPGSGASIGRGRAREMVVNVLLPFSFAREGAGAPGAWHALELYWSYPRLGENHITRHMMEQINVGSWLVGSARRQQGLLHLYHNHCLEGGCAACPLTPA